MTGLQDTALFLYATSSNIDDAPLAWNTAVNRGAW